MKALSAALTNIFRPAQVKPTRTRHKISTKKLAEIHGVKISKASGGGYWADYTAADGSDPLEGNHFCADMDEVRDAVLVFAQSKGE